MTEQMPPVSERLQQARERMRGHTRDNVVIAEMWVWHQELQYQARRFANAKTFHGREVAKVVIRERANGEKSAAVAEQRADMEEEIYSAHVAYRTSEQLVTGAKEALKILHAELDKIRTDRADARAADQFQARTQS